MRRVLVTLSILGVLSCKTSGKSKLDSAVWMDGNQAKLIYFENGTFVLNTCAVTAELEESIKSKKSVVDAKRICNKYSAPVPPAALKASITDALLAPAESSITATKAQRIADIVNQVVDLKAHLERLESGLAGFSEEEAEIIAPEKVAELNNLKLELAKLESESSTLREASRDPEKLKLIDINSTLALQSKIATNAVEQAALLTDMLAEAKLYVLNPNRDSTLIAALTKFPSTCSHGMKYGERKTVQSGIEKLDVQCEKSGQLTILNISCTMPGYEVLSVSGDQKVCVFTGNMKVSSLAATDDGMCALTSNAKLSCWGKVGQFPLTIDLSSKSGNSNLKNSISVGLVASSEQICSINSGNRISECWPSNPLPDQDSSFISVSGGNSEICGLTDQKSAKCWGRNDNQKSTSTPTKLEGIRQISTSNGVGCSVNTSKKVQCWGRYSDSDSNDPSSVPATVLDSIAVSVGSKNICSLNESKKVQCWGNANGVKEVPADLPESRSVVTGSYEACVITTENELKCWGDSKKTPNYRPAPSLKNVLSIISSKSGSNFCAIYDNDKKLSCWGSESFNKPYSISAPESLRQVKAVAITTSGYACALTEFGQIQCFGNTSDIPNSPTKI